MLIPNGGVKPALTIKTLPRTFRFVVLGVIVTLVVVGCSTFPSITDTTPFFGVSLGHYLRGDQRTYVRWKTQEKFDDALRQVCDHGTYCLTVKLDNGTIIPRYHPQGSKDCTDCRLENIRTVKVTKSKVVDDARAAESAVNDPHATYRIQSPYPGDIVKVLNALEK